MKYSFEFLSGMTPCGSHLPMVMNLGEKEGGRETLFPLTDKMSTENALSILFVDFTDKKG